MRHRPAILNRHFKALHTETTNSAVSQKSLDNAQYNTSTRTKGATEPPFCELLNKQILNANLHSSNTRKPVPYAEKDTSEDKQRRRRFQQRFSFKCARVLNGFIYCYISSYLRRSFPQTAINANARDGQRQGSGKVCSRMFQNLLQGMGTPEEFPTTP